MQIKILDCTLRDGGYVNNWNFKKEEINKIIDALSQSDIDIIECGYLDNQQEINIDSTLFSSTEQLENYIQVASEKNIVVMINLNDFDLTQLPIVSKTVINGIRLAFHKKDLNVALKKAKEIIKLGYALYFQPMVTKNYTDIEFLKLIEKVNNLKVEAFYIVDSFGSMTLEEFQRYKVMADSNLLENISLGYHAHNNMQLAFSNAINLCSQFLKRNIIIDASIFGMGRGAGNLNTELIAEYLNKTYGKKYDILPLLGIIDDFLLTLMRKRPWGFSPAHYLSAVSNCHPNYATYLMNKNTNDVVAIHEILKQIPKNKKHVFQEKYIEKLYREHLFQYNSPIKGDMKILKEKILLIASGKSVNDYHELLKIKRKDPSYIIIALNHIPFIKCDFYFFSNQKRYEEFKNMIDDEKKLIITSNIITDKNISTVIDLKKYAFLNQDYFSTNVAILCINYLQSKYVKKIEIAGLDGYSITDNNYSYDETSIVLDQEILIKENRKLETSLKMLQRKIYIEFITPSIFQSTKKMRILGVIPARYHSTRFEGKPLCIINGIPMIKRTYERAKDARTLDKLVVATDSKFIFEFCMNENIPVVMTSDKCLTGTDRIAEVAQKEFYDFYINIQGDEPVIDPKSIDEIISEYKKYQDKYIAYNLYKVITDTLEVSSDTIIKVIVNEKDELLYMSRYPIPFHKQQKKPEYKKQVCVYGFTRKALDIFSNQKVKTINEEFEDIEILRFLDMGYKIKMKRTNVDSIAVDIPDDIQKVERFLNERGYQ